MEGRRESHKEEACGRHSHRGTGYSYTYSRKLNRISIMKITIDVGKIFRVLCGKLSPLLLFILLSLRY